jgi:signal transduction histidine kinase
VSTRARRLPVISIGVKTIVIFLVFVVALASLSVYSLEESRDYTIEAVGIASVHYASFVTSAIERTIYLKYHELYQAGLDEFLNSFLESSNAEFEAMPDLEDYLSSVDSEWKATPYNQTTPFMAEIMANNISTHLREHFVEHYLEEHGVKVYSRISLMNKYGAVVAMSHRTLEYLYADNPSWSEIAVEGDSFDEVRVDPVTGEYGMRVSTRVDNVDGEMIGVMRGWLNFVGLIDESVYLGKAYDSTRMSLISTSGLVLYSDGAFHAFEDVSNSSYFIAIADQSGYFRGTDGGREWLFAYTHSAGYLRYDGGNWVVLVSHDLSEIFQPVDELSDQRLAISALVMVITLALYVAFASSVSRRIRRLSMTADRYSDGDLKARVEVGSGDEIGQLGLAFNEMAAELEVLYSDLEKKVKERTEGLEQATKKLHLLGSVTRHDALNQVSVVMGWVSILEDMVTDKEAQEKLRKIKEASLNLQRYLEFTGVYERVGVKVPEWIDLGKALTHSLFGLGPHKFVLHNGLSGVVVVGDRMLSKVFRNLVDNTVAHGGDRVSRASFTYTETPDGLVIVYEDDGVGIPEDMKARIFERRLHEGRMSFGMYLSKEILAITGITIAETGVPGEGARFEMLVPKGSYRIDATPAAQETPEEQ